MSVLFLPLLKLFVARNESIIFAAFLAFSVSICSIPSSVEFIVFLTTALQLISSCKFICSRVCLSTLTEIVTSFIVSVCNICNTFKSFYFCLTKYLYYCSYSFFMPATIDPVIRFLGFIGVVDVVLPFILVFTMIYAFLEKSNILGLTTQIVQYLGLFTIIVLAFVLVFGLLGVEHLPQNKVWNSVFFIVFMFISVSVFRSLGWFGQDNDWFWWIFVLFFVVLFVLKIWLEQTESKDSSGKKQEKEIAGSEKNKKQ